MTNRERVLMAINHEQPDRSPIDIGGFKVMLNIDEEILQRCHADFRTHYMGFTGPEWEDKWIDDTHFIDILGEGGGYVCAPAHNIQSDVPIENLLAMCDAAYNYEK